jgi:flagellar biosynthetic protein FliP
VSRFLRLLAAPLLAGTIFGGVMAIPYPALAQTGPAIDVPAPIGVVGVDAAPIVVPDVPEVPGVPAIQVTVDNAPGGISSTISLILLLTLGSLLPGMLMMMTSFTRFTVVLSLTRNAIGIPSIPPTPVLLGLSLFLTFFVMKPVVTEVYDQGVSPLLEGTIGVEEAYQKSYQPLRGFMLAQTREEDLRLFLDISDSAQPESREEIGASVLVPAFMISELRAGFLIGFIIYVPFLVIDLVVSTILMSLGMVMLPPTFISLPLKLLLFVLVDGWVLVIGSVVASVQRVT